MFILSLNKLQNLKILLQLLPGLARLILFRERRSSEHIFDAWALRRALSNKLNKLMSILANIPIDLQQKISFIDSDILRVQHILLHLKHTQVIHQSLGRRNQNINLRWTQNGKILGLIRFACALVLNKRTGTVICERERVFETLIRLSTSRSEMLAWTWLTSYLLRVRIMAPLGSLSSVASSFRWRIPFIIGKR